MSKKCPDCGRFMNKKGEGVTAMYYCESCDEYYFNLLFTASTIEKWETTSDIKLKRVAEVKQTDQ